MSGRLLRKVLREQELKPHDSGQELDAEEEDDDDSPVAAAPSRNPFDLLDEQEDEQDVDINNMTSDRIEQEHPVTRSSSYEVSTTNRKSKKKKKKSKDNRSENSSSGKSVVSIMEDLCIDTKSLDKQAVSSRTVNELQMDKKHATPSILTVDPKYLKAENELRKIFGSKVVNSFENHQAAASSRNIRGGRRAAHNPRKTILVSPSGYWPRWDGTLSMELIESKNGLHCFRYVHTSSYMHAQEAFEAAKATHDLNAMASILVRYPYHVEALLTFAEVFKFSGEHQSSADAIGKCLYALEYAWHPLFSPLQGKCQLKYTHDTNKPLFQALFCHMNNMDRRGCHRSALEVCKLLLSLDSDDPMGSLFCIDYFALRAQEFEWLEQFAEEYQSDNSVWLFPNFSYSLAVCRFYLEREAAAKELVVKSEKSTSNDLMKQALMLHPLVLKKLVAKAPLKDQVWTQILNNSLFKSAQAGNPSLEHLINIYIERSYIMWRLPELQSLLKEAALQVVESLKRDGSEARDWACVRKEVFSSEKNEYSHLLLSDFSDTVSTIPPEEIRHFMVGPQLAHEMHNENREANPEGARLPREVLGRNPLAVFLESLLPWVDYGADRNGQMDAHGQQEDQ
uniref:Transcription factor 25 n=1 Tax=Anthurium amnicola TaxID=1678845 RepID=A0A1D1YA67_9ARAE